MFTVQNADTYFITRINRIQDVILLITILYLTMFSTEATNLSPIFVQPWGHEDRSYSCSAATNLGPYLLEPTFGCLSHTLICIHDIPPSSWKIVFCLGGFNVYTFMEWPFLKFVLTLKIFTTLFDFMKRVRSFFFFFFLLYTFNFGCNHFIVCEYERYWVDENWRKIIYCRKVLLNFEFGGWGISVLFLFSRHEPRSLFTWTDLWVLVTYTEMYSRYFFWCFLC